MKNILEALMNVSNFPELRERASLCICSWKAEHEDVYTDFKNKMDNISTGDLSALEEMFSLASDCLSDKAAGMTTSEPAHRALPFGRPSLHGLVLLLPLDVTGDNRRGVDDGYARALAEGAGLKEEQQVKPHLSLALHEAGIRYGVGEILAHVLADIAQRE